MMKIVVIDDDQLVSISLKTILESIGTIEVLATGSSGSDAIQMYQRYRPDVLLMDIRMDGMNGLDAAKKILGTYPAAKILFLTTFSDDEYISSALAIGAKGYILKQDFKGIAPALEAVMNGQNVYGDKVITKLPSIINSRNTFDYAKYDIGEKEQEIMQLVAKGLNNKEIADTLFLSEGTVRNYISSILQKLELRDRTQLAVVYYTGI